MTGSRMNEAYDKAKKCLDQLLSNDQIPFYGYVEIMLQLDAMKREERPHGEWIKYEQFNEIMYYCSNCLVTKGQAVNKFCACCGADMRGKEE